MTLKYTKDHEWIKVEGDMAIIGITDHAACALGELVYVELPKIGDKFSKAASIVVVESSKSASDVYAPVAGEVIEINEALLASPEKVNNSTYDDGWLIKIKITNKNEMNDLMNEDQYKNYLKENN